MFDSERLLQMLEEHFHSRANWGRQIWTVYVLLEWYRVYFGE